MKKYSTNWTEKTFCATFSINDFYLNGIPNRHEFDLNSDENMKMRTSDKLIKMR